MSYEPVNNTIELDGKTVLVIHEEEKASDYVEFSVTDDIIMGVFLNKKNIVLGINTNLSTNRYLSNRLVEIFRAKQGVGETTSPTNKDKFLEWWNNVCYKEPNSFTEIVVPYHELKYHFTETIETDKTENTTWYVYYINPPVGLEVKLGDDHIVSYSSQRIEKIMIIQSKEVDYNLMICLYDKTDSFVEDIDIHTNLPLEELSFIFEYGDLQCARTTDEEQQLYVSLWEQLSPYNSIDENRKLLEEWIKKRDKNGG